MSPRGLDNLVGQDRNEVVVLLPELSVSQHHAKPLLGVSLPVAVEFVLDVAEHRRDDRPYIIFLLPQDREHQTGELGALRQALRISIDARFEDRPFLAAEFFLKVIRRVNGDEDAALLQRRGQLPIPDGPVLYLRAVEKSYVIGRSGYFPGDVLAQILIKLPDK